MPEKVLPAIPPVVPIVLALMPVSPLLAVLALRVLRLEDDRCRRDGVGWPTPDSRWFALWSFMSARPVEVDDVVDATEADCCRSSDNSLVRRLTYVSLSVAREFDGNLIARKLSGVVTHHSFLLLLQLHM